MDGKAALAQINHAETMIATVSTVAEAREMIAMAKAAVAYAQAEHRELAAEAVRLQVLSERRLGELLAATVRAPAGRPPPKESVVDDDRFTAPPTLADMGVTKDLSARAQKLASIPRDDLEEHIAKATENGGVSLAKVLKKINVKAKQEKREEALKQEAQVASCKPLLYAGSCLDIMPTMKKRSVDLLLTDPPYMTDVDDIREFATSWVPLACQLIKTTGRAYICTGSYHEELRAYLEVFATQDLGALKLKDVLVWTYRNTMGPASKFTYKRNWQAIFYLIGSDAPPLTCPSLNELFSVQDINAPDGRQGDRYHTWQKPKALGQRFVRHATNSGDLVLDPFAGTGSFLLAAAQLDRKTYGIESDGEMIAIAESRGCSCAKM